MHPALKILAGLPEILTRQSWIKGVSARDHQGKECDPTSDVASFFSLNGAIDRATILAGQGIRCDHHYSVRASISEACIGDVPFTSLFNDLPETTFDDIESAVEKSKHILIDRIAAVELFLIEIEERERVRGQQAIQRRFYKRMREVPVMLIPECYDEMHRERIV